MGTKRLRPSDAGLMGGQVRRRWPCAGARLRPELDQEQRPHAAILGAQLGRPGQSVLVLAALRLVLQVLGLLGHGFGTNGQATALQLVSPLANQLGGAFDGLVELIETLRHSIDEQAAQLLGALDFGIELEPVRVDVPRSTDGLWTAFTPGVITNVALEHALQRMGA